MLRCLPAGGPVACFNRCQSTAQLFHRAAEGGERRLTWLNVSEMFFLCLRLAKIRLDTSSLALLAYGVTTNAT